MQPLVRMRYGLQTQSTEHSGGSWTETVLYAFTGGIDGALPSAAVAVDGAGNILGTAVEGGSLACSSGCGTLFELSPPSTSGGTWSETTVHLFTGGDDGESPESDLVQGANGTIYGTSLYGSNGNDGTVFEIMPSGGAYAFQVIYNFSGAVQGRLAGDIVLHNGSIYGVTVSGPGSSQGGTVFKLAQSGGAWTSTLIYTFDVNNPSAGWDPIGNIIFDSKGNIYGATYAGGATCGYLGGCGAIWELTRTQSPPTRRPSCMPFRQKTGTTLKALCWRGDALWHCEPRRGVRQ